MKKDPRTMYGGFFLLFHVEQLNEKMTIGPKCSTWNNSYL